MARKATTFLDVARGATVFLGVATTILCAKKGNYFPLYGKGATTFRGVVRRATTFLDVARGATTFLAVARKATIGKGK